MSHDFHYYDAALHERTLQLWVAPTEFPNNVVPMAEVERLFAAEIGCGLRLRGWEAERLVPAAPDGRQPLLLTARFAAPRPR